MSVSQDLSERCHVDYLWHRVWSFEERGTEDPDKLDRVHP